MNDLDSEIIKLSEQVESLTLKINKMEKHFIILYSIIAFFAVIIVINVLVETNTEVIFFYLSICVLFIGIFYIIYKYADNNSYTNK